MIPTIGLMIGLYILARYNEMIQGDKVRLVTKIMPGIFSIITALCIIGLLVSSLNTYLSQLENLSLRQ